MKSPYRPKNHSGISYYSTLFKRLALVFLVLLLSRVAFYQYNRYLFPDTGWEAMPLIFRGGIRFDLSALFYMNGLYLILALLPFPFVFTRPWQIFLKIFYLLINSAGFFFLLFDFVYFRTTLRRIDFSFFREFANERNIAGIFLKALQDYPVFLMVWAGVILLLWFCYGRTHYPVKQTLTLRFFFSRLLALLLALVITTVSIRGGTDRTTRPITMSNAAAYVSEPLEMALVLNTPFCILRTFGKPSVERLDFFSSEEELDSVYTPQHKRDTISSSIRKTEPAMNVVILILESFSREYSGFLNPDALTSHTPFLDSLMEYSLTCSRAYANGRKSIDAVPSVLGSIPSLELSFALTPYALNRVEGLGNALKKLGYRTAFFHGAPNGSLGLDGMSRHFGFDSFYGISEFGDRSHFDGYWGIWDEPFLQFFAKTLNTFEEPFAASVFTLSSHHPFIIPPGYEGVFPESSLPIQKCIRYSDNALRLFFKESSKSSWYWNTLFVLVADHGTYSQDNPRYQSEIESMAIPIIYYDPSLRAVSGGQVYDQYTQQIDIMPTVLDMLGYPFDFFAFGRSIKDSLTIPFVVNYPALFNIMREEKENEPTNELFLKAFRQQYNNRLLDDGLHMGN
ncbi:MAG TPA: LTA synthase family protein [Bacteroidales bacterium]|nr:MAG: Lipoteichoic acid synthase 1 [Bacteroidetes bacterium ADurb.Bin139]HOG25957.1 LTA synthase family protein [Bacteroidales bacterium]HOR12063.1 LTA synthase family protein [Bacteroidales bacterium]HPK38881.1 LTA synthase family protein [Bacteroidales bacterium]HQN81903.1 LTA synthase family protein [Bacteroidales bacterium]